MRKLIALTVAGLLLTGAIQANADQVNVVGVPDDFISISQIVDDEDNQVTELQPTINGDSETYYLNVEAYAPDLLELRVCFYKDSAVTEQNPVEDLCSDDWLATEKWRPESEDFADTPALRQDVAFSSFVPNASEAFTGRTLNFEMIYFQTENTIDNNRNASNDPDGFSVNYGDSSFSMEDTLGGENFGTDSAYHLSFALKPNQRQLKGEDWKVRVLSVYEGETENTTYISADNNTYEILYFASLSNRVDDNRPQVTYGDIYENSSVEETGIKTGDYYSNAEATIFLKADTKFKKGATEIPFGETVPGEDNEWLSLVCQAEGEDPIFVVDSVAKPLIPTLSGSNNAELREDDPGRSLTASLHDCTLTYGSGFPNGEYTAEIEISIGELVITQPPA